MTSTIPLGLCQCGCGQRTQLALTHAENLRRGIKVKLTMAKAEEIRARRAAGVPRQVLADEFGVAVSTISGVVMRQTWR